MLEFMHYGLLGPGIFVVATYLHLVDVEGSWQMKAASRNVKQSKRLGRATEVESNDLK